MSRYRRSLATGATFFFTVNLADRSSRLLVEDIHRLRRAFDVARSRHPFRTLAYCVLPDHLHTVWELPENDADLQRHVDYIHFNAVKHGHSTVSREWPHSSFHVYVERGWSPQDWGECPDADTSGWGERV